MLELSLLGGRTEKSSSINHAADGLNARSTAIAEAMAVQVRFAPSALQRGHRTREGHFGRWHRAYLTTYLSRVQCGSRWLGK